MKLSGWGRFPIQECNVTTPRTVEDIRANILSSTVIARGNGRSYGDSAFSSTNTLDMRRFNRMLSFEERTGLLVIEAGVLLTDVISSFLPLGWFPAVTPGTKYVTIGGMIAADVHGKNHTCVGSFGNCVCWIDIMDANGIVQRCSRDENADLFSWTIGGMGLTGVIIRSAIKLIKIESSWINQKMICTDNLQQTLYQFQEKQNASYSVAWVDCARKGKQLGRSVFITGDHVPKRQLPEDKRISPYSIPVKRPLSVPNYFPSFVMNSFCINIFNSIYYKHYTKKQTESLVDYDSFFYPLDQISNWNRVYGRKGFIQFQCVISIENSSAGLTTLLEAISNSQSVPFLATLKLFGKQQSCFSFPMEGFSLALDFSVTSHSLDLLNTLDHITIAHGGRIYLAKDSRMSAKTLRLTDNRTQDFIHMRSNAPDNSGKTFQSAQSNRLEI